jgi:cellulose synthase/poly-beta-1,6-N-acetylglucosamine synthase-like glycosyltransferase
MRFRELTSTSEHFDIGICAAGASPGLLQLLHSLVEDVGESEGGLERIIVVASDCPSNLIDGLIQFGKYENRLALVVEPSRRGKADAINQILSRGKAALMVLVNSDAFPRPGAIRETLDLLRSDRNTGVVSATPIPEAHPGLTSTLTRFMWTAHNECALTLNHMNLANHSSDEMIVFRRCIVFSLPAGIVNDGAYIAAMSRLRGLRVRLSTRATVGVITPSRITDVIGQRRRILYGHADVWRRTGSMPMTIESLAIVSPGTGLRIFIATLAKNPKFIAVLPVAAVSESISIVMSLYDTLKPSGKHAIWRRYE